VGEYVFLYRTVKLGAIGKLRPKRVAGQNGLAENDELRSLGSGFYELAFDFPERCIAIQLYGRHLSQSNFQ